MTTWARSAVYDQSVVLGPTQQAVYRFVMGATEGGRRPVFTLARIASETGKPVSSVHEALGRLRALGLIGMAARMGRTGGHRLWRVVATVTRSLSPTRHRLAVARVVKRWGASVQRSTEVQSESQSETLWTDDPPAEPVPQREGSFRDAMRRAGFTPWWRLATDDNNDSRDAERERCDPVFAEAAVS